MVQYKKYKTSTGKERWKYKGYWGIDSKTGKTIEPKKQGFKTKKEAKLHYERTIETLNAKQNAIDNKRIKFDELYAEYFEYYKHSGVTETTAIKLNKEVTKHILPYFTGYYVDKIGVSECERFLNAVRSKRKDFRKLVGIAKGIFKYAINHEYIENNPVSKLIVKSDKTVYPKRRIDPYDNVYTPEQIMSYLNFCESHLPYYRYAYFRLLCFTGLRRGEALALKVSDLNVKDKSITVQRTLTESATGTRVSNFTKTQNSSTNTNNVIFLDNETFNVLIKQIADSTEDDFIFKPTNSLSPHFNRAAPNDWNRRMWIKYGDELKALGLHYISPHGFRHSHASLLHALGVNPKDAQHRLRHANIKTTMDIYTHLSNKQKQSTTSILDEFQTGTSKNTSKF